MDIDITLLDKNVDKSQFPGIHQKRLLAFVNHFIINTCTTLNDFIARCETKFLDVERKLQRVEAALIIVESKISSIPDLEKKTTTTVDVEQNETPQHLSNGTETNENESESQEIADNTTEGNEQVTTQVGVEASEDARYEGYFKMVRFGVPINSVKSRMEKDGFDSEILNTPNLILSDGIRIPSSEMTSS